MAANMITVIDDYFAKGCGRCERFATPDCSTRQWQAGLLELRQICLDAGLAAAKATPAQMAFIIRHTCGIVCAPMAGFEMRVSRPASS